MCMVDLPASSLDRIVIPVAFAPFIHCIFQEPATSPAGRFAAHTYGGKFSSPDILRDETGILLPDGTSRMIQGCLAGS